MSAKGRGVSVASGAAKPFLKWVGGKRQLLPRLLAHVPERFGTYHEPFVGGGALFFALRPRRAVLSDTNERLVRTYRGIQKDVEGVIDLLRSYPHDKAFFLEKRRELIDAGSDVEVAAWMIYLNRTGYNGLYRVNRDNQFNVPFGDYTSPSLCDAENLRACARALADARIEHAPFSAVTARAKRGDFVYFDPPYVPLSASSSFTAYTADGFGPAQQAELRDAARDLMGRGVHVVLSNSSAPQVFALYAPNFAIAEVQATRRLNCKAEGRGKVKEVIICNPDAPRGRRKAVSA